VALDVPLAKLFDYLPLTEQSASIGDRVVVPFGSRTRLGVVVETGRASELEPQRLREIRARRDDAPPLPARWLEFVRFLAAYYQRPLGETITHALPPRLRSVRALPGARRRKTAPESPSGTRFAASHALTPAQRAAIDRIRGWFGQYRAFLLHGVTGSGKTEVYMNLIAELVARGEQAMVLVPEISLTPQLAARFQTTFPETRIALMHSGLEDGPRTAAWLAAARGEAAIVLGTRLAILAPLPRLALIVVDEEHDASFKQQDGLRYSARDAAVYRARLESCPVVLGTATPSLESWSNCTTGRYERVSLPERASPGARLPQIRTLDLRREPADDGLAATLLAAIGTRLERGEQSLVFINRRGYAPVLACPACGWTSGCERCTARLVLHAADRCLRCHHCGAEAPIPRSCPVCGNVDLQALGRGTQRIEESLASRFPRARILRVDRDSARRREQLSRALEGVVRGEADILVGTQLLAKGHDFPNLTLVGVLNADSALLSTDYRAAERLHATLSQVAGRAGRRDRSGEVLIQTRYPEHPLFAALARHDFEAFAEAQLAERRAAGFPPFVAEALLRAEAPTLAAAMQFLRDAAREAPRAAEVRLYDPVPLLVTRRAGLERARLTLQSESRPALQAFLTQWNEVLATLAPRGLRWHLDVDPLEYE
jgi:primosomal protein N' (replication factor Y)